MASIPLLPRCCSRAALEAEGVISGLEDVAEMGQPVEECGPHLGVTEHGDPLAEAEFHGDDHARALVELTQQIYWQGTPL